MADSVEEVCHEGTLPGKTLLVYHAVTPRYRLYSSSFALRDLDVKLVGPVTLPDARLDVSGLALEEADAVAVRVLVEDHSVA